MASGGRLESKEININYEIFNNFMIKSILIVLVLLNVHQ